MQISRSAFASLLLLATIAVARELPEPLLPPGTGDEAYPGVRYTGEIAPSVDVDDFVVVGLPGQRLSAKLTTPLSSRLVPVVEIVDPTGAVREVSPAGRAKVKATLDAGGVWRVRVRSSEGLTPGAYELKITQSGAPRARTDRAAADTDGGLVLPVAAGPGARVSLTVKHKGGPLTFVAFRDPTGAAVPGAADRVKEKNGKLSVRSFVIPQRRPAGDYELVLAGNPADPATDVRLTAQVRTAKPKGPRRVRHQALEPRIDLAPLGAAPGRTLEIVASGFDDPDDPEQVPRLFLGDRELGAPAVFGGALIADVPADLALGSAVLALRTSRGQWTRWGTELLVATPPRLFGIAPDAVPEVGGVPVALNGVNLPAAVSATILLDGVATDAEVLTSDGAALTFVAPGHDPGTAIVGVRDDVTGLETAEVAAVLRYRPVPFITDVAPSLVPILGSDSIVLSGGKFAATDHVFLETTEVGVFEELSFTVVSPTALRITAPVRPRGAYLVRVESADGDAEEPVQRIAYFDFVDATAGFGLPTARVGDALDAWTTAFADFDRDGHDDLFLARRGSGAVGTVSETRVLRNDGFGALVDVTLSVLPSIVGDDWRADRLGAADLTEDGWPDLVVATSDLSVPATGSRVRILENVAVPGGRAFVDRTVDLMAPPRLVNPGLSNERIGDSWTTLDLWIGDLDGDGGRPDVIVTDDVLRAEPQVQCGNYCVSNIGGALYGMYWGGTRVFSWDEEARAGLGAFRFDFNRMPRKSGVLVPISGAPPGVYIPACNSTTPCLNEFTPFTGTSLTVGDFDGDGRGDIAVANPGTILRSVVGVGFVPIGSLQVALNIFDPAFGVGMTDVTLEMNDLPGELRAEEVAALRLGGSADDRDVIVFVRRDAPGDGSNALRVLRISGFTEERPDFEDVTATMAPAVDGAEAWQAAAALAHDVNRDGRDDLVLLAEAPVDGDRRAFRILHSVPDGSGGWRLEPAYAALLDNLVAALEHLEGAALAIGDLEGAGRPTFAVTRTSPSGAASDTRLIGTRVDPE